MPILPLPGWKRHCKANTKARSTSSLESQQPPVELRQAHEQDGAQRPQESSKADQPQEANEVDYPQLAQLSIIMTTLCLAVFCVALDNTIISTAIPRISDDFQAFGEIGWFGSAYLLTSCAFQLLYGKLYSYFSTKWTFIGSLAVFEIGSVISGAAPNAIALILGRAIAGLGTGGILNGSMLIIGNVAPLGKRPALTGVLGSMYGIAGVAGPLLGGAFTSDVSWRWCFYINLPLGGATLFVIALLYRPKSQTKPKKLEPGLTAKLRQFDALGTIIFLPMIVCLILALQWGGLEYPWSSGRVIAVLVVFSVLLIAFIATQILAKNDATVPPRVMRQRSMAAAFFFRFAVGSAHFMVTYYLPTWFQAIKGVSPVQSGIRSLSLIISLVVASILGGVLISKLGYYNPFMILTSVLTSIGAGLLSTLEVNSGAGMWIGYPVIFGLGAGLGMQQSIIVAQTVLGPSDIPTGTALLTFAQTLGGAIFISVGQNVLQSRLVQRLQGIVPDPSAVFAGGATEFVDLVPHDRLEQARVAYNSAIIAVFYAAASMAAISFLGAIALEWKKVRSKKELMAEMAKKRAEAQKSSPQNVEGR